MKSNIKQLLIPPYRLNKHHLDVKTQMSDVSTADYQSSNDFLQQASSESSALKMEPAASSHFSVHILNAEPYKKNFDSSPDSLE
jgi:hypothetical protein